MKGGPSWWGLAWRGFPPVGTCKHPWGPAVPPSPGDIPALQAEPSCPRVVSAGAERGSGLGTYPPVGTSGWNFHWSSSPSKYRRFMILFFSSGGMKFSMIKYLSE